MVTFRAASDFDGSPTQGDAERRRHQRVKVALSGRYMLQDRREFDCRTIDMSPGGVSLIAPEKGDLGSRVVAYLDEIGRVEGTITRLTRQGFALSLHATKAKRDRLAEQLTWLANRQELGIAEDRRHDRLVPRKLRSTLRTSDGREHWAVIVDVSRSGVALRSDLPLPVGASVVIGQTPGRVVRRFPGGLALEFLRLMPVERFDENIEL